MPSVIRGDILVFGAFLMLARWIPPRSGEGERGWTTALCLIATFAVLTLIARFACTDAQGNVGFWPSNGALVVAWLVLPRRFGLAVSLASFFVNVWINSFFNYTIFQNLLYASLNIEVSAVTAVMTKRFCGAAIDLSRLKRFAAFAIGALLACIFEAGIGEYFNGVTAGYSSIFHEWLQWTLSDTIGLLISTPAILFATRFRSYAKYFPVSALESVGLACLTIASACWAFSQPTSSAFLFCFPVLILTAFRAGPPLVLLNALAISVIASAFTAHGLGPLVSIGGPGLVARQEALQPFMVSLLLAALPSNSALGERNRNALRLTRLNRSAKAARAEALAASRAKSDFIANISHEIRTPLNGILGMTEVLIAQSKDAKILGQLRIVQESGQGLLTVLNDILDFAKIESGKITLSPADFDLERLVNDSFTAFRAQADRQGLAYTRVLSAEAAGLYRGDEVRIRQILNNLLSNAMKFTHAGVVSLNVGLEGGLLSFAVSDSGIGISKEQQQKLFQRFSQADSSTTRLFGGTGLGLAISGHLAALMDGEILVRSEPGEGSTFTLRIPLARAQAPDVPVDEGDALAGEPALAPGLRILAAEDNPVNQQVLSAILEAGAVDLTLVPDGLQAVEAFKRTSFDVVLMDMLMPVMDGASAIGQMREWERRSALNRTPILALTANAMQHHLDTYARLDIDGVVAKPVKIERLFSAIAEVAGRPQTL